MRRYVHDDPLQLAYVERRRAWAEEIGRPYPKRRKVEDRPEPAVIDLEDDELG